MIHVAVLGYGTVGSGVVEVIEKNKEMVNKRAAEPVNLKYILDIRDFPGDPYEEKIVHDVNIIMEDEEVSIVCETMGGVGAAYEFTKMALERGKSVCTSNKELVAAHGPELLKTAHAHNCNYLFEASVGGGIPIIRPLNYSLTAEKIEAITGILNGTTNYILTKMEKEGADFDAVLKKAQEKGYAERNPSADIEGHDTCRKIAILASLMLAKTVDYREIYTEGITKVTAADILYAKAMGRTIKLLGMAEDQNGKTFAMVAPFLISPENPLFMVNDVFNAVCVRGNMLGDSMYYGKGAGKLPTASAVVSDVVDCARHKGKIIMCLWEEEKAQIADIKEAEHAFFLRLKPEALKAAEELFDGRKDPNVTQIVEIPGRTEDIGFVTPVIKEKDFQAAAHRLGDGLLGKIRIGR